MYEERWFIIAIRIIEESGSGEFVFESDDGCLCRFNVFATDNELPSEVCLGVLASTEERLRFIDAPEWEDVFGGRRWT